MRTEALSGSGRAEEVSRIATEVGTLALALLLVSVWFSITLTYVSLGLAWAASVALWLTTAVRRVEARRLAWGLLVPLGAFLVLSAAAGLAGVAAGRSLDVLKAEVIGVGALAAGASVRRAAQVPLLLGLLLLMGAASGLFSIYQAAVVFDGHIGVRYRVHGFWAPGAYVSYGNVLAMVGAVGLGWCVLGAPAPRRYAGVCVAAMLVGLVLNFTRAAWVGLGVVTTGVAVWRRSLAALAAGALVLGALAVVPVGRTVIDRVRSAFDPTAEVNVDRVARYHVGAAVLRDYPWLGTGPGGLSVVYPRYALPEAPENWHLHNTYLQLAVERGPAAVVAWLALFGVGTVRALRMAGFSPCMRRASALGIGLALVVMAILGLFNYVWEDWRVRSLALALLGLAWSPALRGPEDDGTA